MACAVPQIESQQNTSGSSSSTSTIRPPRFTMEGVGARVIRGPDWKWGKQVTVLMHSQVSRAIRSNQNMAD